MFTKQLERTKRPSTNLDHVVSTLNPATQLKAFELNEQQRHKLMLKQRAEAAKMNAVRMEILDWSKNDDFALVRFEMKSSDFLVSLQHEANEPQRMPAKLKRKLEDYVPIVWKQLYPQEYGTLQNAVREHFQETMLLPCRLEQFSFKFRGRTENYGKFLATKRKIAKQLLITNEPVRIVLDFAAKELPDSVFSLKDAPQNCRAANCVDGLGERNAVSHSWLSRFLNKDVDKMNYLLRWEWYPKLIELLKQQFRRLKQPPPRLVQCIEGLIRREIMQVKTVWLSKLLSELSSVHTTPMLQFKLEIDAYEIQLTPDLSTIIEMYASLARRVANIGVRKLSPLKFEINMTQSVAVFNAESQFINLEMDEIYLAEYIADLKEAVQQSFKPVQEFLDNFKATYSCIIQSADFDHYDFMAASHPFLHYVVKMMNYSNQKNALQLLPQVEHFVMATVQTTPAVSQLVSAAKNFMKLVADEMTAQHIDYLKTICNDYEQIKSCISKEPESTEELIEISNYMSMIKEQYLLQLEERVQWARHIGSQLQHLTEFSQYHWNLYIITLNWVNDIKLVCEENAAQLAHFSELFKQYLEVRIYKFNDAIDDLYSKVDLLNNIQDLSELEGSGEYAVFFRNIIARLKEFDDCVNWINKEERLLSLSETAYPKLVEAKLFVSKFCTEKN